jgi:hypothetical protein
LNPHPRRLSPPKSKFLSTDDGPILLEGNIALAELLTGEDPTLFYEKLFES